MAQVQSGYQKPLTGKECGQLKQLSKYLGEQTKPVIDYAVNHWWKFASVAGRQQDIVSRRSEYRILVETPCSGGKLAYARVQMPLSQEAPVQLIATGTEKEAVYELSSQELTELLDGLKSPVRHTVTTGLPDAEEHSRHRGFRTGL